MKADLIKYLRKISKKPSQSITTKAKLGKARP